MYKHYCKICGKPFYAKSARRDYCGKRCRAIGKDKKSKKSQLCETCQNACGGCSWSDRFKPVEGWEAFPTIIKQGDGRETSSYKIINCPSYIYG